MFPSTDPCLWVTVHLHKAIAVGGGEIKLCFGPEHVCDSPVSSRISCLVLKERRVFLSEAFLSEVLCLVLVLL